MSRKKKSKSLLRSQDNIGVDYAIEAPRRNKENLNWNKLVHMRGSMKRKSLKRYRSMSKNKTTRRGSRLVARKSHRLQKSKSNNIEHVINTAKEIVGEKRGKSKKNLKKK